MPDLFFGCDGNNYAAYLTMYSSMMSSIETRRGVKDALKRGIFSVARSMNPGCRADVDKYMEETFMEHGGNIHEKLQISGHSNRCRHLWNNTKSCYLQELAWKIKHQHLTVLA